jgi:hypothetical protein
VAMSSGNVSGVGITPMIESQLRRAE